MPWFGVWDIGPWLIFPILMCVGMMTMMLLSGRGPLGRHKHGSSYLGEGPRDSALETLRQRFVSGELTRQEYDEQRDLLLRA